MCLSKIGKILKGKSRKTETGYKAVVKYVTGKNFKYSPVHFQTQTKWEKGKWYDADYSHAIPISSESGNKRVWGPRLEKLFKQTLGKVPQGYEFMIEGGWTEHYYPCGFHYFLNANDAKKWNPGIWYGLRTATVLKCEFKNIVVRNGDQSGKIVNVARQMRIIKEVK